MAATIADIDVSNTEYTNINTESGIAAGVDIFLSNKSLSFLRVQVAASIVGKF